MKQGLQIAGTTRIFAKEVNGKTFYSTSISTKNLDGTYDRMYISVQFPKDTVIQNNTDVMILDSFLSFYKDKNGLAKLKLVVMKFEIEGTNQQPEFVADNSSDLPF